MAKKISTDNEAVEFAAYLGIDWGDQEHSVCLAAVGTRKVETWTVMHTPDDLNTWLSRLLERFEGKPVAVCLEISRGPLVSVLLRHPLVTVFAINRQTSSRCLGRSRLRFRGRR